MNTVCYIYGQHIYIYVERNNVLNGDQVQQ